MLLLDMSEGELATQAEANDYPKWDSLCLLRWLGAETLQAALVTPAQASVAPTLARDTLMNLAARIGTSYLMIRTDVVREIGPFARGGNTFELLNAVAFAQSILETNRAVIALEPTNRFNNRATVNIGVEHNGEWHCEILGPGFDASDLQRNGTPPEYICGGLAFDATEFTPIRQLAFSIEPQTRCSMASRIAARIDNIIQHIFPAMGVTPTGSADEFCRNWLIARGNTGLCREQIFAFPTRAFRRTFDTAQLLYHYRQSHYARGSFVLSSGVLEDGRQVFWDFADSKKKWIT